MGAIRDLLVGIVTGFQATLRSVSATVRGVFSKRERHLRISDIEPSWLEAGRSKVEWVVTHEDGKKLWFERRKDALAHFEDEFLSSDIIRVETTSEGFVIDERKIK